MTKFRHAAKWFLLNGSLLGLTYWWLFADAEWAGNLVGFYLVNHLLWALLLLTALKDIPEIKEAQLKGPSVNKHLVNSFDAILIVLFASQGKFWFAAVTLLINVFEGYFFGKTAH